MRSIPLGKLFTRKQMLAMLEIVRDEKLDPIETKDKIRQEIVVPNLKDIEKKCGQQMDTNYVAYMAIAALSSAVIETEID